MVFVIKFTREIGRAPRRRMETRVRFEDRDGKPVGEDMLLETWLNAQKIGPNYDMIEQFVNNINEKFWW